MPDYKYDNADILMNMTNHISFNFAEGIKVALNPFIFDNHGLVQQGQHIHFLKIFSLHLVKNNQTNKNTKSHNNTSSLQYIELQFLITS